MYGIVSRIEGTVNLGFTAAPQAGETEYTAQNKIFDTYTPMVNVKVTIGGIERIVNTDLVTVGEILADLGFYPDEDDELNHSPDDIVIEGMSIVLREIDEMGIILYEVISHQTETKYIQTIPAGTKQVIQEGEDGLSTLVLRQLYVDGVLESETVISEELTKKPIKKKVNIGLGGTYTDKDGKRYPYSYYIDVIATAYGGEMFSGLTYTGKQVELGMIAVDPDYIPLGSKVYVVGDYGDYGVCYAEDTGSKVIGKSIDIYMGDDLEVMKEFGRRNMRVYILK
ncbi:MAG: 3D domain-containing protein [Eubacteriales bacterium]|nr:3D domain-containing protein [Eubacteriales bacterium]